MAALLIVVLSALQGILALPWLFALEIIGGRDRTGKVRSGWLMESVVVVGIATALFAGLLFFVPNPIMARVFGFILQTQMVLTVAILAPWALGYLWPKGAAIAYAAFREGVRQPMFALLMGGALVALLVSLVLPYFTFGEDYKMMYELGFDIIMFASLVFACIAASMFISEEIEGRTAVTLLSKPVSRFDFLVGKFAGILMAAFLMLFVLGSMLQGFLVIRTWIEKMDPVPPPAWYLASLATLRPNGAQQVIFSEMAIWFQLSQEVLANLVLCFCQVGVMTALAVALSTRVPITVNLPVVATIFLLAHLVPVVVEMTSAQAADQGQSGGVLALLNFTGQAFYAILPDLELFRVSVAVVGDSPILPGIYWTHVLCTLLYALIYMAVPLMLGLLLFEGRDVG